MKDALIICTKDRPIDLSRCLESLEGCSELPSRILVVDSSASDDSLNAVNAHSSATNIAVEYLRSTGGVTLQRNFGLSILAKDPSLDIVHFIDDDVEVGQQYFREMKNFFASHPKASGIGGAVTDFMSPGKPSLIRRIGRIASTQPGKVLPTGMNICANDFEDVIRVDWLSGCSMSYRLSRVNTIRFDESRSGYSLGEDLDFSLRASEFGELWHNPNSQLVHHLSPSGRHKLPELARMGVQNRWMLAEAKLGPVTKGWVIFGTIFESVLLVLRGLKRRDRLWIDCAFQETKALRVILRGES